MQINPQGQNLSPEEIAAILAKRGAKALQSDVDTVIAKPVTDFRPQTSQKSTDPKDIDAILKKRGAKPLSSNNARTESSEDIESPIEERIPSLAQADAGKKQRILAIEQEIERRKQRQADIQKLSLKSFLGTDGRDYLDDVEFTNNYSEEMQALLAEKEQLMKGLSSEAKEWQISEIDKKLNALRQQGVKKESDNIKALTNEKNRLLYDMAPVTKEEKDTYWLQGGEDIRNGGIKYLQLRALYGPKYDRIRTAAYEEAEEARMKEFIKPVYEKNQFSPKPKTEEIISYANFMYGKQEKLPSLPGVNPDAITTLAQNIKTSREWRNMDYAEKRKYLDKRVSEYISTLEFPTGEGAKPVDKGALKNSILSNMLPSFMFDEDNQLTVEGGKLWAESQIYTLTNVLEHQRQQLIELGLNPDNIALTDEKDQKRFQELKVLYGAENMDKWYFDLQAERRLNNKTLEKYAKLLKAPEVRRGLRDVGTAVKNTDLQNWASLGVKELFDSAEILAIATKIEKGDPITHAEKKTMEAYATLNYMSGLGLQSMSYTVAKGVVDMIPYIAQFALTGGAYTGTKTAIETAAKGATGFAAKTVSVAGKKFTMAEIGARAAGTAVQAAVVPQQWAKNAITYATDNVSLIADPETGKLVAEIDHNTGLGTGKAVARGFWDAYAEFYTERMGKHIMAGISKGKGAVLKGLTGTETVKRTALAGFMETKGIKTVAELSQKVGKKAGWDGIMEEYMEEFVNYYMSGIADPKNLEGPITFRDGIALNKEWWRNQFTTFLTVAGFGTVIMKPVQIGAEAIVGKNQTFTGKYENGDSFSIKLPRELVGQILKEFETSEGKLTDNSSLNIAKIFEQWQGKLTAEQMKFAIQYTIAKGAEANLEEFIKKTENKLITDQLESGLGGTLKGTTQESRMNFEKLSPEEKAEVEAENNRITVKYAELNDNGLIGVDQNTGQMIEPTKKILESQLKYIQKTIEDKTGLDVAGNMTVSQENTEEVAKLQQQETVLKNQIEMMSKEVIPFDKMDAITKNQTLIDEAKEGKINTGIISQIDESSYELTLSDGRIIKWLVNPAAKKKDKEKIADALKNGEKVGLKLTQYDNTPDGWNPDLSIERGGTPIYDKLDVTIGKTVVGTVQLNDPKTVASKQVSKDAVIDDITKKAEAVTGKNKVEIAKQRVSAAEAKLKDLQKRRKEKKGNLGFAFDPRSEAEEDVELFRAMVDYVIAIGAKTIEQIKEAIEKLSGISLSNADAEYLLNAANAVAASGVGQDNITEENKEEVIKNFIASINETDWSAISAEDIISTIKAGVEKSNDLTTKDKEYIISFVDQNNEKIINNITKRQLKAAGLAKKAPVLSLNELTLPEFGGITMSGTQKVDSFRNGYAPIWRTIADALNTSRDNVEKKFLYIARSKEFQSTVSNDAQYRNFINNLKGKDIITDKIAEMLERSSLSSAVSLFNQYGSLTLSEQYALLIGDNNKSSFKLLNPPQRIEDFMSSFWSTVAKYPGGYDAIRKRLFNHKEERDNRFNTHGNKSYTWYESQTPEKREELRREQHESDIALLSELTGIAPAIWNDYFSFRTKETYAETSKTSKAETNFRTYDQLLKHDTFRSGWHRIQSDIALHLTNLTKKSEAEFEDAFNIFFTRGNEETGVLSNLYKLSTATQIRDELSLRFTTVDGKGSNSMIQNNMIFDIASRITHLPIGNDLTAFYYDLKKEAEIIFLNGVKSTKEADSKEGTPTLNMSSEDLWLAQILNFLQGTESYNAWMGQFSDKDQLPFILAPKYKLPEKESSEWNEFIADNPNYEESVAWLYSNFVAINQSLFSSILPSPPEGLTPKEKWDFKANQYRKLAEEFVYNFSRNMKDIIEVFDGSIESYDNDIIALSKRRASSNSPGWNFNTNIEGGLAEEYTFALLNDKFGDWEIFDGMEFMTGDYARRAQVSMGSTLSKENDPEMKILSSIKGLHTVIAEDNNARGITKGNIINIDILAEAFPNSKYSQLKAFMEANTIDRASFGSTTKAFEKAKGKEVKKSSMIDLWDNDGKLIAKPEIKEQSIAIRKTKDTYVQQDLRHSSTPKSAKISSQLLGNVLGLPSGNTIAELMLQAQLESIGSFRESIGDKSIVDFKTEWLKEKINQNTQEEIARLLDMGMTIYEPAYINLLRKMFSSEVTRHALEISINRVTTQEIADPNGILLGRRPTSDGKHILLPDIASSIAGGRESDNQFIGHAEKAIAFVKAEENKIKYRDLYDSNNELREWEITERNGEIPGELIISVRTPNSNYHTMTVGRLKKNIKGNFTMLDRESQKAGGSDFDGDQRFNWVAYKNKEGVMISNSTRDGLANKILNKIAEDYMKPQMDQQIREPIDTKAFDKIVDALREKEQKPTPYDPRVWDKIRNENITGIKLKGMLTNLVTVYSIINSKKIPFKTSFTLPILKMEGVTAYQGRKTKDKDKRRYQYYALTKEEAKDYGEFVEEIEVDTTGFLFKGSIINGKYDYTQEYNDLSKEFKEKTGNRFDILDNTEAGLKIQEEFFKFIEGKGYKGYSESAELKVTGENDYIVTFANKGIAKPIKLTGINKDTHGLIKTALVNFLNMAFDNAKDPKVEIMGLNEHTANMFFTAIFGDQSIDVSDRAVIDQHIKNVSDYFTSDLVRDFVGYMRRNDSGMRSPDMKVVEFELQKSYPKNQVTQLLDFYQKSQELGEIKKFYNLTQQAPQTVAELQEAKQLYRKIKNNSKDDFKFIDVKNLFDHNGNPITEFAIIPESLRIAEEVIFSDSFEYSIAGREIYKAIMNRLSLTGKKLRYLTADQLASISYGMNAIAAIRALGVTQPLVSLERDLLSEIKELKKAYPKNAFLQMVGKTMRKGRAGIEVLTDYQRGAISEVQLMKIRSDFANLSLIDKAVADKFMAYALIKWGPTISTWRGSFYNLLSEQYRIDLSKKVEKELALWNDEFIGLTSREKYQITQWILRNSKEKRLKDIAVISPDRSFYYDYNSMSTIDFPISTETLDGIQQISNAEEYEVYAKRFGFDTKEFSDYVVRTSGQNKIKFFARQQISLLDQMANSMFPPYSDTGSTVKDMMPESAVGELLASEDEVLNQFVMDHLQKMYPGVQIFTDHDAFIEFVMKYGDRGFNVDPMAIGHAFANAVYIDPTRAVQSSLIHEYGHIYWDALPNDHPIKNKLRELFKQQYTFGSIEDLDEQIILEMGRAGVQMAKVSLNGNLLEKFLQYLRQFWAEVKNLFGKATPQELVNKLAWDVWKNSDKIVPNTNHGEAILRNMVQNDENSAEVGGNNISTVTNIIHDVQREKFHSQKIATAMVKRAQNMARRLTGEKIEEDPDEVIDKWEDAAEKGTIMHSIAEMVFMDHQKSKEEIKRFKDQFEQEKDYHLFVKSLGELKESYENAYPGIKWHSEEKVISKKFNVVGTADLIGELSDNQLIVIDFKTTDQELANGEMKPLENYNKAQSVFTAPLDNMPQSKYAVHSLQLNLYGNMLEENSNSTIPNESNKVVALRVAPIIRQINPNNNKIVSAKIGNQVNIQRSDVTRMLADKLMSWDHQKQMSFEESSKIRQSLTELDMPKNMVDDTMKAIHFFQQIFGDLKKATREGIESLRMAEIGGLKFRMFDPSRGYKASDFYKVGTKPVMTMEEIFFADFNGWDKETFLLNRDKYFVNKEVSARFVPVLNPNANESIWSHLKHGMNDLYLEEVGTSTSNLKVGDKMMMIYDLPGATGKIKRQYFYYTLKSIDKKNNKLIMTNEETGDDVTISPPSPYSGALRVHTEAPAGMDIKPNSYNPRYNYEKEAIYERHYDHEKLSGVTPDSGLSDELLYQRRSNLRKMHQFFNEMDTMEKLEAWANDSEAVKAFYNVLSGLDPKLAAPLMNFVKEINLNNFFSKEIAREASASISQPMPILLNTYYLLLDKNDAAWKDWSNMGWVRSWIPSSLIEFKYTPVTWFTTMSEYFNMDYQASIFKLEQNFSEYIGDIDYAKATIVSKNGVKYWKLPTDGSIVNDPTIKGFLDKLYAYHDKYDQNRVKAIKNGLYPLLKTANVYMSRTEAIELWGNRWGTILHDKLAPQPFDDIKLVRMRYDERGNKVPAVDKAGNQVIMSLRQIKEDLGLHNMTPTQLKDFFGPSWRAYKIISMLGKSAGVLGMLNYYIKQAKRIYNKETADDINTKANANPKHTLKSDRKVMTVIGHGSSKYSTKNLLTAETSSLKTILHRHHMQPLMSPLEWIVSTYQEKGSENILDYIRTWGEYVLYKKKPSNTNEGFSNVINFLNRWASRTLILFGIEGQINNFAIGQGFNAVRQPEMYLKGMSRLFTNGIPNIKALEKAWNLAKKLGVADMVTDTKFDQIEKEYKVAGVDINKLEAWGYLFMKFAEKGNQIPILVGGMTDKEWESYDVNGNIIDKKNQLTNYRKLQVVSTIAAIHGHYAVINMAPASVTNFGKVFMHFRKWMQTYILSHLAPYSIDRNMMVNSGTIPTLKLIAKLVVYNSKSVEQRQQKNIDAIEAINARRENDPTNIINGVNQYIETLVAEVDGGRVKYKNLSENDRKNLIYAVGNLAIMIGGYLIIEAITSGADDPTKKKKVKWANFMPMLLRFQTDVTWLFNGESYKYLVESPAPAVAMVANFVEFIYQLLGYTFTNNPKYVLLEDAKYGDQGSPKFIVAGTRVMWGGSGIRTAIKQGVKYDRKTTMIDLKELGMTEEKMLELGLESSLISKYDLMEYGKQYRFFKEVQDLSHKYNMAKENDLEPTELYDVIEGQKILKRGYNDIVEALTMHNFARQLENDPEIAAWWERSKEEAKIYKKAEDQRRGQREKTITRSAAEIRDRLEKSK